MVDTDNHDLCMQNLPRPYQTSFVTLLPYKLQHSMSIAYIYPGEQRMDYHDLIPYRAQYSLLMVLHKHTAIICKTRSKLAETISAWFTVCGAA